MKNLKIGTRLGAGFSALLVLLVIIAAIGYVSVVRVHHGLETVYEDRTVPLAAISTVDRLLIRNRLLVMDMMLNSTPANIEKRDTEFRANLDKLQKAWDVEAKSDLTDDEKKLVEEFEAQRPTYMKEGLLAARERILARDVKGAEAVYFDKISPLYPKVAEPVQKLVQIQVDVARSEYEAANRLRTTVTILMLSISAAALALGVALAWFITRSVTRPIAEAMGAAQQLSKGDLCIPSGERSEDETGKLLAAIDGTVGQLKTIVGGIKESSDTIATACSQIAAGNADLSQRTEEQAASLEETASSMEEITGAVKQNADNARQASQLAVSASEVANKGSAVVRQVVETMDGITDSSKRIADIIGTIDGIAFQTNILALNAAVEAARAGEQGRGFAVVATEVRNLAQRSAAAAKEIKGLITDSVGKVDEGSRQVNEAGQTMGEIMTSVKRVTDIMAEIAAASQEQSSGIEQVNKAIAQMDEVTQQNAALVEQAAAAAESMQEQAQRLTRAVAIFRLEDGDFGGAEAVLAPAPALPAERRSASFERRSAQSVERRPAQGTSNVSRLPQKPKAVKEAAAHAEPARTRKVAGDEDGWTEF